MPKLTKNAKIMPLIALLSVAVMTPACTTRVMQSNADNITIKVKRKGLRKDKIAEKALAEATTHCRNNGFAKATPTKTFKDGRFNVIEYKCES